MGEIFKVPPAILKRYQDLYDLVESSEDGRLDADVVARYLGRNKRWLLDTINHGYAPFAFSDGSKGRAVNYIGILPFYQFEMQTRFMDIKNVSIF